MPEQAVVTVNTPDGEEIVFKVSEETAAFLETMPFEERGKFISEAILAYERKERGA